MVSGVLFIDVDGTLVGPDGVADRVWPALDRLRAAGWSVALCTGRPGRGLAMDYARRADPSGLHVFESGAAVLHADGRVATSAPVPPETVRAALALALDGQATVEAYTAAGCYFAPHYDDYIKRHEELLGFAAEVGPPPPGTDIVRVQWVVPRPAWPAWAPIVGALDGLDIHVGRSPRMPDVFFVAATRRGVSKAWGLSAVLDRLGVDPARAAMIGDASNDVPALDAVGIPIAVADAAPDARAAARHEVPSAAAGGVADAADWLASLPLQAH